MTALKPCECGSTMQPKLYWSGINHIDACLKCEQPGCCKSTAWFPTEAEALAAWNHCAPAPTREALLRWLCGPDCSCFEPRTACWRTINMTAAADAVLALLGGADAKP